MKGLRKYLTPFAPDQSGAVSVLYELGGILVICDAGGCTGNICGFDEPRWFLHKSALFSAGLRDMDAILGRDDKLVAKLVDAAAQMKADFVAIIGTPVPAVIATDYQALKRMIQKKLDLPVLIVEATGTNLYDKGEEEAYLELFRNFAAEQLPVEPDRIGVIGVTPQNMSDLKIEEKLKTALGADEEKCICCYGMGAGLAEVKKASAAAKNIVVSPSGLRAAKYLERQFGTPYETAFPLAEQMLPDMDYTGKKILVIHQQVTANALRSELSERSGGSADITVGSWFMVKPELSMQGDIHLTEEDEFIELASKGFDVIIADPVFRNMIPDFEGDFVDMPHFAVSGRLVQ